MPSFLLGYGQQILQASSLLVSSPPWFFQGRACHQIPLRFSQMPSFLLGYGQQILQASSLSTFGLVLLSCGLSCPSWLHCLASSLPLSSPPWVFQGTASNQFDPLWVQMEFQVPHIRPSSLIDPPFSSS